jgi:hypothetical protein
MNFVTLRKFLCTLSVGAALLLAMSVQTQAQRRYPSNGRWRARNYGQRVSASRHRRNAIRRDLIRHQRSERRVFNAQRRQQRSIYGNSRDWRYQQRQQRAALRRHQRSERVELRQRWRNNRRQR